MGGGISRSVAPVTKQPDEFKIDRKLSSEFDKGYIAELELKAKALEENARLAEERIQEQAKAFEELKRQLNERNVAKRSIEQKLRITAKEDWSEENKSERSIDSSRTPASVTESIRGNGGQSRHRRSGDLNNRNPGQIGKALKNYKRRTKDKNVTSSNPGETDSVYLLPRGGVYVWTKAGPIQFGMPPETLKDSMNLGLEVPTIFVVPRERFNMQNGVNVSELEFPAFFNFFVRQRKIILITYPDCCEDLRTIMKEALDGPDLNQLYIQTEYSKFATDEMKAAMADHEKEIAFFREPRPGVPTIEVENLISFEFFDVMGECVLPNDVVIRDDEFGYTVLQDNDVFAVISDDDAKSCFLPEAQKEEKAEDEIPATFNIPKFGITILGSSHGFDPKGWTSGFVVWINGQGVMVDPPPHSSAMLKESGIQPKSITATILTHCHADHDAGTIQKMITETKVTLMTTQTVFRSLLRKYAGVSGLAPMLLEQLVNFRPVYLEEPTYWGGASFRFFYSLHAIPCVGFEVSFEGKRLVYSADTFYDPEQLHKLCDRGILSPGRRDALINFPWDCDIVLHEAGVPPIHTPISAFEQLPIEQQKNLQLIHIGGKEAKHAVERGFKIAKPGVENTIVLCESSINAESVDLLQLIASVDIFRGFAIAEALELLFMSEQGFYKEGEVIAKKGTPGDKFIIIMSGCASVSFDKTKKFFNPGDYLGEISVMTNDTRTATIEAESEVTTVEIDKYAFNHFLQVDRLLYNRMQNLVKARMDGSWAAIAQNSVLRNLSAAQKTSLQASFTRRDMKQNQCIFKANDEAKYAVLILNGQFVFDEVHNVDPYELLTLTHHNIGKASRKTRSHDAVIDTTPFDNLTTGTFICDMYAMTESLPLTVTLRCVSATGTAFTVEQSQILAFLDNNPSTLLALIKTIVVL